MEVGHRERNLGWGMASRNMPKEVMIPLKGGANQAWGGDGECIGKQRKQGVQRPYMCNAKQHYSN